MSELRANETATLDAPPLGPVPCSSRRSVRFFGKDEIQSLVLDLKFTDIQHM